MIDFSQTQEHPALPTVRCRHLEREQRSYLPFRQLYVWAAADGDILGRYRQRWLVCVKCWGALSDMAEPDWERAR